jgi:hypothetical protein
VNKNAFEHEFVLKLCFETNAHADGLSLMGTAIRKIGDVMLHLSSDELQMILMNRADIGSAERAERHLLFCERCQDAAVAAEIELAALRRGL